MNNANQLSSKIHDYLSRQTQEAGQQITLFGIVMSINFPLFGVLWRLESPPSINEFILRIIATLLCMLLALHQHWPKGCNKALPIYWYVTLIFCLPFFFTYLTLLHNGSTLWLMNCVSAMFFLLIINSVLNSLIILFLGISCALILFFIQGSPIVYSPAQSVNLFSLTVTFLAALVIGSLFARDRELVHEGKISGMRLMAGSLAHDLRTPLATINIQAELQENLLKEVKNPRLKQELLDTLNKISQGINIGNQVISMQLNNILLEKFDTQQFSIYPIKDLLKKTIDDYPFNCNQKNLLHLTLEPSFSIWVEPIAFKNMLWNLLNNSFGFIEQCGKGNISVWLTLGDEADDFNYLHFKDTAKGLSPKSASKIFDLLQTERKDGKGIGLAYCRLFMQTAGGRISCSGEPDKYIHFTIRFPKID